MHDEFKKASSLLCCTVQISPNTLNEQKKLQVFSVEMLRQILDAAQANALSVSCAVHSVDMVAFFLFQCKVQLVGREVDERLLLLYSWLHFHIHHPWPCSWLEGEFEVIGLAALSTLIAPQDVYGACGVTAVSPVAQEGVDQLLSPLADFSHVHHIIGQHHLQKSGTF